MRVSIFIIVTSMRSKAVIETRLTHDVHRFATSLLADAATRDSAPLRQLAEFRTFLVATLEHHHTTEDDLLWPILTAAAPDIAAPLVELTEEHHELDAALEALRSVPVA